MKKINFVILYIAVFALCSCQALFFEDRSGQDIRFSVSMQKEPDTRTSYSGVVVNGRERIDWENGDRVTVFLYLDHVQNYFFKDESGNFTSNDYTSSNYSVLVNKNNHIGDPAYISRGQLSSQGSANTLKWVGTGEDKVEHIFYSVYPAGSGQVYKDAAGTMKVDFANLAQQESAQDIMQYAYMAAAAGPYFTDGDENSNYNNGMVDLNYYPMVTTIYLTVINDTGKPVNNLSAVLTSADGSLPLAGPYTIEIADTKVFQNKTAVASHYTPIINIPSSNQGFVSRLEQTVSLGQNKTGDAIFFLLPADYETKNLNLSLSGDGKNYNFKLNQTEVENLWAFHKYNVTVKLKGGDLSFDDVKLSAAQLICSILLALQDDPRIEQLYRSLHPEDFTADDQYNTNRWHNEFTDWFKNTFISKVNNDFQHVDELLKNLTANQAEVLLEFLKLVEEIDIGDKKIISENIKASDFDLLPNATRIKSLKGDNNATIDFTGTRFTEINIACFKTVTIDNCENLTTVKADGSNRSMKEFTLKNSPNCKDVTITNAEALESILIENIEPDDDRNFNLSIYNLDSNIKSITLRNIPRFEKCTVTNGNNLQFTLTIDNCSNGLNDGTSASFNLPNNANGKVVEVITNSPKVKVNYNN